MRKFTILLMCLFGIGLSYAEEVNIGLAKNDDVASSDDVWLLYIPGYFFLDNNPVIRNEYNAYGSTDVAIFDYNLNPSTIHFNCEYIDRNVEIVDTRFEINLDEYVPVTQCFFNNDALYECITCDVETVINEWGDEEHIYSNYRVINQNGDVLYTFEVPEGYKCDGRPDFFKVSDDVIIVRQEYCKINDEYFHCDCWYSLKVGQTGSIAAVKQMSEMKINNNPVSKGDDLVVTVGDDSRQSSVTVTTLSGIAVKEVPVVNGRAVVNTSDLPCGLYIASQKGEGTSAKFIVK